MRIAYLECFSGMSGDMFLGALVDAGVPPRLLEETVAALGVGAKLEISRVMRSGISATKVDVWVDGEKDMPREEYWAKQDVAQATLPAEAEHHRHVHEHAHSHEHDSSRACRDIRGRERPRHMRTSILASRAERDSQDYFGGCDFRVGKEDGDRHL